MFSSVAQVPTTDTCDSWDWYMAEPPGAVFMEDVASGFPRSANGRMVRQDCRYWDILTDARCLFSPAARVFACQTQFG